MVQSLEPDVASESDEETPDDGECSSSEEEEEEKENTPPDRGWSKPTPSPLRLSSLSLPSVLPRHRQSTELG
jgi:hypothetical protein